MWPFLLNFGLICFLWADLHHLVQSGAKSILFPSIVSSIGLVKSIEIIIFKVVYDSPFSGELTHLKHIWNVACLGFFYCLKNTHLCCKPLTWCAYGDYSLLFTTEFFITLLFEVWMVTLKCINQVMKSVCIVSFAKISLYGLSWLGE